MSILSIEACLMHKHTELKTMISNTRPRETASLVGIVLPPARPRSIHSIDNRRSSLRHVMVCTLMMFLPSLGGSYSGDTAIEYVSSDSGSKIIVDVASDGTVDPLQTKGLQTEKAPGYRYSMKTAYRGDVETHSSIENSSYTDTMSTISTKPATRKAIEVTHVAPRQGLLEEFYDLFQFQNGMMTLENSNSVSKKLFQRLLSTYRKADVVVHRSYPTSESTRC